MNIRGHSLLSIQPIRDDGEPGYRVARSLKQAVSITYLIGDDAKLTTPKSAIESDKRNSHPAAAYHKTGMQAIRAMCSCRDHVLITLNTWAHSAFFAATQCLISRIISIPVRSHPLVVDSWCARQALRIFSPSKRCASRSCRHQTATKTNKNTISG